MLQYFFFILCAVAMFLSPHNNSANAQDFVGNSFQDLGAAANGALGNSGEAGGGSGVVNQYAKKYQKSQNPIVSNSGLMPDSSYNMFFVRKDGTSNDQATLRLTSPVALNGCVKMVAPSVEKRRNGRVMFIDVTDAVVGVDKSVRYSHFQCKQGAHAPQLDVTLDRSELIDNDVNLIIMKTGAFTDYFDVEADLKAVTLTPRSSNAFRPFKNPTIENPLEFVFYPDNLVVLHVPQAHGEPELNQQVQRVAEQEGLKPASDKNIQPNIDEMHTKSFYFIDDKRDFAQKLQNDGQMLFGQVHVPETLYGPNGPYQAPKKLDVYARLPHELD